LPMLLMLSLRYAMISLFSPLRHYWYDDIAADIDASSAIIRH
jgi:hypothetical protein